MSQFTDWFLASPEEAKEIIISEIPQEKWDFVTLEGIIDSDLMELASYLEAEFSDFDILEFDPMVVEIKSSFIKALAKIEDSRINEITDKWSTLEGIGGVDRDVLTEALKKMISISQKALPENKSILQIWGIGGNSAEIHNTIDVYNDVIYDDDVDDGDKAYDINDDDWR